MTYEELRDRVIEDVNYGRDLIIKGDIIKKVKWMNRFFENCIERTIKDEEKELNATATNENV